MNPIFKVHEASVETFTGSGPTGRIFTTAVTVKGLLDDGLVVKQSSAGEQMVQKTVFYADFEDADKFTIESRVTVNGRATTVRAVRPRDAGPLFAQVQHVEVELV